MKIQMAEALNQVFLKKIGAVCLYVDEAFNILHTIGPYKDFLDLPDETFSTNLLDIAPDALKVVLTTAVRKASRLNEQVTLSDTWRRIKDEELERIHLLVSPVNLPVGRGACYLVLFMPTPLSELMPPRSLDISEWDNDQPQTIVLEQALKETQANLQAALEEAQTTNEALQATNEELMAANEELQSTNEELQSVNEELHTVNAEYQLKIDELAALNADMNNLLSSTQIGTIFLDTNKRIRRFTASIQNQFELLESDIGRPLDHLAGKFAASDLATMKENIDLVLAGGDPQQRKIRTDDGRFYLKRIYPFINARNEIGGVVLTFIDITELTIAQEATLRTDLLLKHTEQTAHVGSWEMDINSGESIWSDEFFRICGFQPNEFTPTAEIGFQLIHPDDRERAQQAVERSIQEKEPYDIEKRIIRPDGEVRYVRSRGDIIFDQFGNAAKLRGSFIDITEQTLAVEAAEEAENQFVIFFQNAPIGLSITNPDGTLSRVNKAFCELLGYSAEELLALNLADITHPDDIDISRQMMSDLLSGTKSSEPIEKRYVTKDGRITWTQVRSALHRDPHGKPAFYLTNILDINDRKRIDEIQARFESIFRATEDLVSFVDNDYVYRAVNNQYLTYWDTTEEAILGKSVPQLMTKEAFENVIKPRLEKCMAGQKIRYQSEFNFPGKGRRFMDVTYSPVDLRDGTIGGIAVSVRDITELKEKENQLSAAMNELKQSNAELEQFAYAASHDLQEPLNTIANFTGLLINDYATDLDKVAQHMLHVTHDGALRMKRMIQALLQFSRVRRSKRSFGPIDCEQMIVNLRQDLQALIERTEAQIDFTHCEVIYGDESMIHQLVQNLLTNAIKFHRAGMPPRITVSISDAGPEWCVSVTDNGIGIDENDYDEIFGIFRRLHTREEYEGTGLGLALCKQIVELHGGRIWVESVVGERSTFYFTLSKQEHAYAAN